MLKTSSGCRRKMFYYCQGHVSESRICERILVESVFFQRFFYPVHYVCVRVVVILTNFTQPATNRVNHIQYFEYHKSLLMTLTEGVTMEGIRNPSPDSRWRPAEEIQTTWLVAQPHNVCVYHTKTQNVHIFKKKKKRAHTNSQTTHLWSLPK